MIRVITKDKKEVKVYNYHKYQTLNCDGDGTETFEATYHLYLNKKDAQKFSVNEKVEVAFMGEDWKVKSISYLEKDLYCVELTRKDTNVKNDTTVTPEKDCKLDNDCNCDCSDEDAGEETTVGETKLPKHMIVIESDGVKDTIASYFKDGSLEKVEVAKLHPSDKFNFNTGAKVAFDKLLKINQSATTSTGEEVGDGEEPLWDATGTILHVGDYVLVNKGLEVTAGIIAKVDGQFVLRNTQGDEALEMWPQYTLVWRP